MATSSEAVVYDTIVSIALIIDQREGETWTDLISTADSYVDLLPRSSLCKSGNIPLMIFQTIITFSKLLNLFTTSIFYIWNEKPYMYIIW